jgi:hypothetical protein
MKVLFIGGTGNISAACSRRAIDMGIDLFHLNRGSSGVSIPGVQSIIADVKDSERVKDALSGHEFDVVANFIAYTPDDVAQDIGMFSGKTKQYILSARPLLIRNRSAIPSSLNQRLCAIRIGIIRATRLLVRICSCVLTASRVFLSPL